MNVVTLTQAEAASWAASFFARDGMGWPLLIIVSVGWGAFRFARWFAPLVERLVQATIDFMGKLDERITQIEHDGTAARTTLDGVGRKLDDLIEEVRASRSSTEHRL